MEIIPAVDIMRGKVVRLVRGDPSKYKSYEHLGDPLSVARRWISNGARYLHIIDLDAALGFGSNFEVIERIVKGSTVPLQVGGGIRSLDAARRYLDIGVDRVILGSLAFKSPGSISLLIEEYNPERVVVAVDHWKGKVMIKGWKEMADIMIDEAISRFSSMGIRYFLVTSIMRDGTMKGVDLNVLRELTGSFDVNLIVAGGVGSIKDLILLNRIGVYGVVIGKAIYEGLSLIHI